MKLSPLKALCLGALLGIGCVMLMAAGLTTWVGKFVGDGFGLTNVAQVLPLLPTIPTPASVVLHVDGLGDILESTHLTVSDNGVTSDVNYYHTTNSFPLVPGTVWNWRKRQQFFSTNADFNVSGVVLSNSVQNEAELEISNASASQIIGHLTFAMTKYGPLTTNDLYIPAHQQVLISGSARGIGTTTNIVTLPQQP